VLERFRNAFVRTSCSNAMTSCILISPSP
jgi:hypothetical protein